MIATALLLVNPASRRGARHRAAVERVFREEGVTLDVTATERPGHATEIVRQLGRDYDAVFVLGGDGTVMEAATALAGTARPVGVLPGGTGNLVAGTLGIPANIARAARSLIHGNAERFDLACIDGGRHFAFAAGFGVDASMLVAASASSKRRLGIAAYVLTAYRAALSRDRFDVIATVDGTEVRLPATLAMVANFGSLFRGLFTIGPGIEPNDGTLDLCVFSPAGVTDIVTIVWRAWRKDFRPHPAMRFFKGKRIRLCSEPVRPVQADGDLIGHTPLDITIVPLAATFLVPKR